MPRSKGIEATDGARHGLLLHVDVTLLGFMIS
jgi:hypothetical protein